MAENIWREINIHVKSEFLEIFCDVIHMVVPYGFYIEDYSDMQEVVPTISRVDLIDDELLSKNKEESIIHIYISAEDNPDESIYFLENRFKYLDLKYKILVSDISEQDWENNWKNYYHPTKIGNKIVICPSWEDYEVNDCDLVITLDPGMAFGTGTHESTKICIQLLETYCIDKNSLLDIGCGSGILSLASSLLGVDLVDGVDIDPISIKVSKENAKLNNLSNINFIQGDLTEKITKKYDIIVANIVADVIINLVSDIKPYLNMGGIFICSGIIKSREEQVVSFLLDNGFNLIEKKYENDWVGIVSKL